MVKHQLPPFRRYMGYWYDTYYFLNIVTVYTQFGYAQMDMDKYKDDFNP